MKIISSDELRKIKVIDNKEELVDLRVYSPFLKFNIASYVIKNGGMKSKEDAHFVRKEVATRLNKAIELLPSGYGISIRLLKKITLYGMNKSLEKKWKIGYQK